jgi:mannose-6-phosphate isomerase-like protein (cupin superfamily)
MAQPFTFLLHDMDLHIFEETQNYEIQVKDTRDYYDDKYNNTADPVSLSLKSFLLLNLPYYISENNQQFISDSGLEKQLKIFDDLLKPNYTVHTKRDILFGTPGSSTVLQYHTHFRKFLYVVSGKIRIKMTSHKNTEHLHLIKDYEYYEFRSPIPIFNESGEAEKIKTIDFEVSQGSCVYLPPFWWYSIQYEDKSSSVACLTYTTIINSIVNVPNTVLYYIQQQNITKRVGKPIELPEPLVVQEDKTVITAETGNVDNKP